MQVMSLDYSQEFHFCGLYVILPLLCTPAISQMTQCHIPEDLNLH